MDSVTAIRIKHITLLISSLQEQLTKLRQDNTQHPGYWCIVNAEEYCEEVQYDWSKFLTADKGINS